MLTPKITQWAAPVQLERNGDAFEKEVTLPNTDGKIFYKFVVDGKWVINHSATYESDDANNINNVVLPHLIMKSTSGPRPHLSKKSIPSALSSAGDHDDITTKRSIAFKRALKGLSGKSSNDLGKISHVLAALLRACGSAYEQPFHLRTSCDFVENLLIS